MATRVFVLDDDGRIVAELHKLRTADLDRADVLVTQVAPPASTDQYRWEDGAWVDDPINQVPAPVGANTVGNA